VSLALSEPVYVDPFTQVQSQHNAHEARRHLDAVLPQELDWTIGWVWVQLPVPFCVLIELWREGHHPAGCLAKLIVALN